MRRAAPRLLAVALEGLVADAAPATTLARVQSCWPSVAGPAVSAEARPIAEREGVVTVACESAVWAQELDLLSAELLERLTRALGPAREGAPLRALRFVTEASEPRP